MVNRRVVEQERIKMKRRRDYGDWMIERLKIGAAFCAIFFIIYYIFTLLGII